MKYGLASKSWNEAEYQAMMKVLSGDYYKMGEYCRTFEEKVAEWTGSKYAVFCNSGSSANLLSVAAIRHDPRTKGDDRDEVLVPAVSWSTTYYPIQQLGYKPIFVDVDDKTFNISIEDLESKISNKTRGIFAVNLLGNPCDYSSLRRICDEHDLFLLEDNCESMGAMYNGQRTGSLGDIGTHSTFFSHHMSTMEGGICTTDDELLYEIMKSLRAHGWVRDVDNKELFYSHFDRSENSFYEYFHFVLPGYNFRPTEVQGALGLTQLDKLDTFINARMENAEYFKERLDQSSCGFEMQNETVGAQSSWFGFGLMFATRSDRDHAVTLFEANGVECRPIVSGNMARQPVFSGCDIPNLQGAERIHECGVMVGNHQLNIHAQIDYLFSHFK